MDVATMKKSLENQIGDINKDLKNIYLPYEAVLILLGKRTAFKTALELIDSLQQEQKPAEWSEEDGKKIAKIIMVLMSSPVEYAEEIELLKSLRPQPHYKPSEEQMEALMLAIEGKCPPTSYMSRRLEDLYEALANEFHVECKLD